MSKDCHLWFPAGKRNGSENASSWQPEHNGGSRGRKDVLKKDLIITEARNNR